MMTERHININDFDYPLPDERIAKFPLERRDGSKLLVYRNGNIAERRFADIGEELPSDTLFVFNNTKVVRARLVMHKPSGARVEGIIFLGVPIDSDVANIIQAQLLFLASTDNTSDISLYLNTPGGVVSSGLGIYDTMQIIEPDVATICTGMAASMGSVLLCAGAKGKRSALKHSRVMIHQPLGGAQGQASDILIAAQEIEKLKKELYTIISDHSGQPIERIYADGDRDFWLTSQEALEYGMIDEILTKKSK